MALDAQGRTIDYLRISVTDRCNFRCVYCMPEEGICLGRHEDMLTYEEIARLVRIAAKHLGIKHVRLTGGEPLARLGIEDLIADISNTPGIEAIALTTNGSMLSAKAAALKKAGLTRVNISLDTLDPVQFSEITRRGKLDDVLDGIDAALRIGFNPVKINCVVVHSMRQNIRAFIELTEKKPVHVRFIEYMPVGAGTCAAGSTSWTSEDIFPTNELIDHIDTLLYEDGKPALIPADGETPTTWGPAFAMRVPGARGTIGFITPMSNHFCSSCNRVRLTADGKVKPCLFSADEYDVRSALRFGTDEDVLRVLSQAVHVKPAEHGERAESARSMVQIGG